MLEEESFPFVSVQGVRTWRNLIGKIHRIEGPAIEYNNGDTEWFLNGMRHRLDGPAIDYVNGFMEWYLYGKRYNTKEEFIDALSPQELGIALFSKSFFNS
jgi:hypothetical protein